VCSSDLNKVLHIKTSDNYLLEGVYIKNSKAKANIIAFQGNGSIYIYGMPFYNLFSESVPSNVFVVNYRGYGNSTGTPTVKGVLDDAKYAIEYFNTHLNKNKLPNIMFGFSLGGFVAANSLKHSDFKGLILVGTFSNSKDMIEFTKKDKVPFFVRPFISFKVDPNVYLLDNLTPVSRFNKPVLFIHGGNDSVIPCYMSKRLYESSPSTDKSIYIFDGVSHGDVLDVDIHRKRSNKLVSEFINKLL